MARSQFNNLGTHFKFDPIIIDGGFGTTLEQLFRLDISNTPLWSAQAILDHADVVIKAHLAFLHAGAEVISTSTYQCSYSTFARAGYTSADARRVMLKSVHLASKARQIFLDEQASNGDPLRDVRIALSLGPFGASLSPAQEFDGFYPPPFGPKAYCQDADAENCNTFDDDEVAKNESIHALTQFHFERLLIIFENDASWNSIDYIAFETVPLTREIQAIRRAMGLLGERIARGGTSTKPWWISMVFPDGHYPETNKDGTPRTRVADIVSTAVENSTPIYPCPSGLGINCTPVEFLSKLVWELEDSIQTLQKTEISNLQSDLSKDSTIKPFLVLYPNGGDVYDPSNQTWVEKNKNGEESWAKALKESFRPSEIWSGVFLGGCCRTTPTHIQALKQILRITPE
ncbi:Homocysteine S-methyltransferase [Lentinula aff. detonsa]|uniref:Homocysteine S-methyltransferase n=1 Tax=Lentinula aff. detonsa TaxID=2804958 RepID=A0AA38NR31_9AGAR|nr:Homocysteine S-methyltransferase [Lentinula aff. detonsa]